MALVQVVLRLARNPGVPEGDDTQGYVITAPLTADGRLSENEWREHKSACTVVRVKPGDDRDADGLLTRRGDNWFFHYDEPREGDDEPIFRLSDHSLAVGAYITIRENDGRENTYRVVEHAPVVKS